MRVMICLSTPVFHPERTMGRAFGPSTRPAVEPVLHDQADGTGDQPGALKGNVACETDVRF